MSKKLYLGNLNYDVRNEDLETLLGDFGTVTSVNIIKDRETGRAKGFGFAEMSSSEEAEKALSNLNGSDFMGRTLRVSEAIDKRR